jgi:hypothetical protein
VRMWNEIRPGSGGRRGPQHSSLSGQHRGKQGHGEEAQAVLEILIVFPALLFFFLGTAGNTQHGGGDGSSRLRFPAPSRRV